MYKKIILRALLLIVAVVVVVFAMVASKTSASVSSTSLQNATADEIANIAITYTVDNHCVVSGKPTVVLSRLVTDDDLAAMGL